MDEATFLAMYGDGKAQGLQEPLKKRVVNLLEKHPDQLEGEDRQRARDRIAVEPWRLYFPYRPEEMP